MTTSTTDTARPLAYPSDLMEKHMERNPDLEESYQAGEHLVNDLVDDFSWTNLTVTVKDRRSKEMLEILSHSSGTVRAGEMLAIMGPSGSGKTTLLNALAHRQAAAGAKTTGDIFANRQKMSQQKIRQLSTYVEQEDALIGSLTVLETMRFAAGLALPSSTGKREKARRVNDLIASFGLQQQTHTIVGTPLKKGLSGGQKKRLGVVSRLVTDPKILFLDEPTSGLDSMLSYEVMSYIRKLAKQHNLIIIASIHQPSTSTFQLFDKLCLLSLGKTCFFGPRNDAASFLASVGFSLPAQTNPAEFYLELINTDLATAGSEAWERNQLITHSWETSEHAIILQKEMDSLDSSTRMTDLSKAQLDSPGVAQVFVVLLHRSWIKATRDIVAYGIRVVMYLGLAILMGTVFLRFGNHQQYIQPFINALFFGGAFMSFMAVAYVPALLEDRATFISERANGLVGPLAFTIANFVIGVPFLFLIAVLFSVVTYFLIGFQQTASGFWLYTVWLFLDLLAAESLVFFVASIFPIFVVALAVTAFANGLWMCVDGFLVPLSILNPFWKYVFHYIDYQAFVFQGMMVNQFRNSLYECDRLGTEYACQYPSPLNANGKIGGMAVLEALKISPDSEREWFGIIVAIIVVYRILGYLALRLLR